MEENESTVSKVENTELVSKSYKVFGTADSDNKPAVLNSIKLIEHTDNIIKYVNVGRKAQLGICYELNATYVDESYKSSFKNIDDYASMLFNIKHTTSNLYRQVGRLFVSVDDNGIPYVKDGLPQFSVGQLIELLPLYKESESDGKAKLIKLLSDGKFGQYSTTKAIRAAVKDSLLIESTNSKAEATTENSGESATPSKSSNDNEFIKRLDLVKENVYSLNEIVSQSTDNTKVMESVLDLVNKVDEIYQLLTTDTTTDTTK